MELSLEEKATNYDTYKHIHLLGKLIHIVVNDLLSRADTHDASKLESPELEGFSKSKPLADITYGSKEFDDEKTKLAVALQHHYAKNDHHPEHYKSGINDMNLIQILEMFLDWKASSMRHNDGNIRKSIELNAKRFGIDSQLTKILENTASLFDRID